LAGEQGYQSQEMSTPLQVIAGAEETLREPPADDTATVAPLIELIVSVRAQLRAAKQWALADEIRQRLSTLGIILEDGPTETTWKKD
jgi:cysteinyl-tRNA synthetase